MFLYTFNFLNRMLLRKGAHDAKNTVPRKYFAVGFLSGRNRKTMTKYGRSKLLGLTLKHFWRFLEAHKFIEDSYRRTPSNVVALLGQLFLFKSSEYAGIIATINLIYQGRNACFTLIVVCVTATQQARGIIISLYYGLCEVQRQKSCSEPTRNRNRTASRSSERSQMVFPLSSPFVLTGGTKPKFTDRSLSSTNSSHISTREYNVASKLSSKLSTCLWL